MGFAAAPHNVVRCPPLLWASLAVLLLLLNEPIKEPGFEQGLACDAAQLRSVIKLLEHVRGHDHIETFGRQAGPGPAGLAESCENAFAFIKAEVSFLCRNRQSLRLGALGGPR